MIQTLWTKPKRTLLATTFARKRQNFTLYIYTHIVCLLNYVSSSNLVQIAARLLVQLS